MKAFYKLMFYHVYKSLLNEDGTSPIQGTASSHQGVALFIMGFIQLTNLIVLLSIVDMALPYDFGIVIKYASRKEIGIVIILFIALLNFTFFQKGSREKTIDEFSKQPIEQRKKGARITLIYGLTSTVLVFILSYLRVTL